MRSPDFTRTAATLPALYHEDPSSYEQIDRYLGLADALHESMLELLEDLEFAIGPDAATAQILTQAIQSYNTIYEDLRTHQQLYLQPVVRWLDARPDLASEARGVVQFALQDLHQTCLLQFNAAAFQRSMKLRTLPASTDPREAALIRAQGALEIVDLGEKADRLLNVLDRRVSALSSAILGTS